MTKEDLAALSELMDKKFDEKLNPISERLNKMDNRLERLENDVAELREDVGNIKEDFAEVRVTVDEICKWIVSNFDYKYPFRV